MNFKHELSPSKPLLRSTQSLILGGDMISDLDKQMNEKLIRVKRKDEPIPEVAIEPQMCICNNCPGT